MEYAAIDWLNENSYRAYPLQEDADRSTDHVDFPIIPDNFILDAQIIYSSKSLAFADLVATPNSPIYTDVGTPSQPEVGGTYIFGHPSLRKIEITPSRQATVYFGSAENEFIIPDVDAAEYPLYIRNAGGSLAVFGEGLRTLPVVAENTIILCNAPVEPAACYQFNDAWLGVNSLNAVPEYETEPDTYAPKLPLVSTTSTSLDGDVLLEAGYNFRVEINDNAIELEVGSYGLRMDCTTEFIPSEEKDCDKIVSYINGIPPDTNNSFRLLAGSSINITKGEALADFDDNIDESPILANPHTLFVGLTFLATDLCAPINIYPSNN